MGSFLLTPGGKAGSDLIDQEYFSSGHIHKALASALTKAEDMSVHINLLFLENTLSADTGCLVFSKARKHNQFLNIHRVKHLHIRHIIPERGRKKKKLKHLEEDQNCRAIVGCV